MSSGEKKGTGKRVRFSETPPSVREFQADEDGPMLKRQALDPMEALEGEIMGVCLAESGASAGMDAAACAASRRAARRQELMSGFEEGSGAALLGEIESAEAGYDEPDEMFNDAGVPFEPFHLKREREEGYFDEDGNYVEFKMGDVEDAWADELATVEVDEAWLSRVMSGPARQAAEVLAAEEEPDLGPEQIAGYKRRLVDLLLPGENVLQALRRLAAVRAHGAVAAGGIGGGQAMPAVSDAMVTGQQPRMLSNGQAMPPGVRDKFESLTGLSSVLMDQGVYGVHSMSREQLERSMLREELAEQAQQAPQQEQQAAPVTASGHAGSPAAASIGSAGAADAGLQLAERLLAAAAPAAGGRGQANGSKNGGSAGSEEAVVAPVTPAVDADQDIFGRGEEEEEEEGPGTGPPSVDGARQQQDRQQPREAQPAEAEAGLAAGERDSGGDVAMQDPQQPAAAAAAAQEQHQHQQQAVAAGAPGIGRSAAAAAAAVGAAAAAAAASGGGAAGTAGEPQELDGFTRDATSGYWFNSGMGCYYDAERQLFGDAASGMWFSYDAVTGQYQVAAS